MAVQAYQSSGELDPDGWYHLSVLQTFGGDPAAGRQSAEQVLKSSPNHILALSAAATAAHLTERQAALAISLARDRCARKALRSVRRGNDRQRRAD